MRGLKLFFVAVVSLLGAILAGAQTLERGDIDGTVFDASHAAVPRANVTLSSPSTGFQRTTAADPAGHYQFLQVPPGV
jgi:Carboxypeptidase regulatory-like domain